MSYEAQEICAQLGQILSRQIRVREESERATVARDLDRAREAALQVLRVPPDSLDALLALDLDLQAVVRSHGLAVSSRGTVVTDGHTPTDEQVRKLVNWLEDRIRGTECFSARTPPFFPSSDNSGRRGP